MTIWTLHQDPLEVSDGNGRREGFDRIEDAWDFIGGNMEWNDVVLVGEPSETTLAEARERVLRERWDGVECPCCDGWMKVYHTPFPGVAARVMCDMYRVGGQQRDWVHIPVCPHNNSGGDALKARHWGLIEARDGERDDGSSRTGWWRLTEHGLEFVLGIVSILRYADIQRPSTCQGLSGEPLWIHTAIGQRFDYRELMGR
jgi:hypothetical protein